MGNIKVNEHDYFRFLAEVELYLKQHPGSSEEQSLIKTYINRELKLRELFIARKTYYDAFASQKENQPAFAAEMYHKYKEAQYEISKLRVDHEVEC